MSSQPSPQQFDFTRFLNAQEPWYNNVVTELKAGRKETHWMWFIFPQIEGLGQSTMARRFAIRNLAEARAYADHSILGTRLLECCEALLMHAGRSPTEILGYPDDLKLRSSMTLFAAARPDVPQFRAILAAFFGGLDDDLTLQILRRQA